MNAVTPQPRRFTRAEFDRIARTGGFGRLRVELRRGRIVEMSPQHNPHARLKMKLQRALDMAIAAAGLRLETVTEVSVGFGDGFEPMPDIVVIDPTLAPEALEGPLPAAAVKLVIEVASSSLADDLGAKASEYAEAGLAEYWVADVTARTLHRHGAPVDGVYTRIETSNLTDGAQSWAAAGLALGKSVVA